MLDFSTATIAQLIALYYLFQKDPFMRKKYNLNPVMNDYNEKFPHLEKELTRMYVALEHEFSDRGLL